MRDHDPLTIEDFNGYYNRGDEETVPPDHFSQVNNIQFTESGFETRDGIDVYQSPISIALDNVLRIHPFTMQSQQSLLVLTSGGNIHHVISPTVVHLNILQKALMTDFNAVAIAGRAYITPFFTNASNQEVGLQNEFLYVYLGAGVPARKAAGNPPTSGSPLIATPSGVGFSDLGFHIFAVVYETDTGYLTALGPQIFATATSISQTVGYDITNIPVPTDPGVIKKHIVATKRILNYNGDQDGYDFFFVPGGDMLNAVTTKHIDFFDIDLLEEAAHLIDNFSEIPAGVGLCTYHGRLVLTTTFTDISVAYVSHEGEPEAFDQVDGLLIVPLDGNPLTNCQELRDILYLFKKTRTVGYSDNQDVPSSWQPFIVDEGIGSPVHGIGTVLDSGGVNVDFLLVADFSGIMLFDGAYTRPELSWKIRDYWFGLDRTQFRRLELINDSIGEKLYCVLPEGNVLVGNYQNGMNTKDIRWSIWTYDIPIRTLELINTSTILLGASVNGSNQSGIYKIIPNRTNDTLYDTSDNVVTVKIPNPYIKTAYTDLGEGENIHHFGGIRLRVNGVGNLKPTVYSLDDVLSQILIPIPMLVTTERQLTRLCNFQTQRAALKLETTELNERFNIGRIIVYAKEVFTEFPSVQ